MKLLKIFQKIWLVAAVIAIVTAVSSLFSNALFNYKVYFPLICAFFCAILYWNIGKQIKFKEEVNKK